MTPEQPLALRLAEQFEFFKRSSHATHDGEPLHIAAAAELRRLHAEVESLREANERFGQRQAWWTERMFAYEQTMRQALGTLRNALDFAFLPDHHMERRDIHDAITALREALGDSHD